MAVVPGDLEAQSLVNEGAYALIPDLVGDEPGLVADATADAAALPNAPSDAAQTTALTNPTPVS